MMANVRECNFKLKKNKVLVCRENKDSISNKNNNNY